MVTMRIAPVRVALFSVLIPVLLFAGTPVKSTKGTFSMKKNDKVAYSVLYANYQRNSHANAMVQITGTRAWKKLFTEDFNELPTAPPITLLAHNTTIGVQVNPYFLMYENGKFRHWHYTFQVMSGIGAFFNDFYFVIENAGLKRYWRYDNTILIDDVPIIGIVDYTEPYLVAPFSNGILYAKQFMGGPTRAPKEFDIGFSIFGQVLSEWFYGERGRFFDVLLTSSGDKLLFTYQNSIHRFDTKTGKKINVFDPGLPQIFKVSLDLSGNLIVHAVNKEEKEVIVAFDPEGSKLWEHEVTGSVRNDQPPVCGENGTVFYLGDSSLCCIEHGKLAWKSELFPCVDPLMTSSRGNTIIVQSGLHLLVYDGTGKNLVKKLITSDTTEMFTAPPVPAGDGRVYIASAKALYCFK